MHFGVPDWDAGRRYLQSASVDISPWTKKVKMEVAMPVLLMPAPAAIAAAA